MEDAPMALIGGLLLTIVVSTALAAMVVVSTIERRASAAYLLALELRMAAEGALALTLEELRTADWTAALAGAGSAHWAAPRPGLDIPALTAAIQAETMMAGAHGADTPVWQVFAQAEWAVVTGLPGRVEVASWVADDWLEGDGDPRRDSNGVLLVRAVAAAGVAVAWTEALCGRDPDGRIRLRHGRSW
jgi:hypothetical protein